MFTNQLGFSLIELALFVIALGLLIPITVLFVECSTALLPSRFNTLKVKGERPRVAVLMPAHNEALGISATLQTITTQLTHQDRLIVIADNCTDETAAIAKGFGATVLERHDLHRRGKGYALDYGLRFMEADPPDVVVMMDADCIVHQGAIERIACVASALRRPVQANYRMAPPANPEPKDLISALAVIVNNLVRPTGLARLGWPCPLQGTGMAFPWAIIREVPLASGNLVEDLKLGLDLTIAGHPPVFCPDAKVTAVLPQQQAAKEQRTRWEHGSLQTLLTQVPRLFKLFVRQKRFELLASALDLSIPPLSLLVMLWASAMGGALLAGVLGAAWIPAIVLAIAGFLIIVSIVGAWAKYGRGYMPIQTLLAVPIYILWKIPLYLMFLVRPETKWIRTRRNAVNVLSSQ
ncbi:MAG: glycosyltransferase [Coleofasciculus sp. S288]|nr:glycosyltransferase [Coleofasciculus sp. S288]